MTKPLRVAILGKSSHIGGGGSKNSELMAESLALAGHQVDRYRVHHAANDPGGNPLFAPLIAEVVRIGHAASRRLMGGEFIPFELPLLRSWPSRYDIVHINDHWVSVSPWTMRWLSRRVPTALTLNDASYFTGGCLYPYECMRFEIGCGNCPLQGLMRMFVDVTRPAVKAKGRILRRSKMTLTAPSRWMSELASHSQFIDDAPQIIPYGIRRHIFHPGRRAAARASLGISPQEKVVLISASHLGDPRKGCQIAADAINLLPEPRPTALLLGHAVEPVKRILRTRSVCAGFVDNEERLADMYAAADVFAFSSLTDNLPFSVIESLACGTPVLCFDRGGTPEILYSELDGEVIPEMSAKSLSRALEAWLTKLPYDEQLRRAVAGGTSRFSLERYGADLSALYHRMIDGREREL